MQSTSSPSGPALFDAGMFIAALLKGDPRHAEALALVEAARHGAVEACTTPGILSEVYGALTWERALPRHRPEEASIAVRLLVEDPSAIRVLNEGLDVALRALELATAYRLTARRIHDARHAAAALMAGLCSVYTYDIEDWKAFEAAGLQIAGPRSTLTRLQR